MSRLQRVISILGAMVTILTGILLLLSPEDGLAFVFVILALSLLMEGVRSLTYYASMARHMVGGKAALYRGVLFLDAGLFALSMTDVPRIYIILYLVATYGFSGVIDVGRSIEAIRLHAPSWKLTMATGVVNLLVAVLCLVFLRDEAVVVRLYAFGLFYSSVLRIASALRRSTIIYIA